jgi:tetratricopeptide (TPR) repeat protein
MPCSMASEGQAPASVVTTTPFWRTPFFAMLVITAGALLVYLNSFSIPFVFDDEPSILGNPTIRSLASAWWPPTDYGSITVAGRPLLNFSLGVSYAISGTKVWGYHALNILIHVLAGLVLFGGVRRTLQRPGLEPRFGAQAAEIALVTALLWTLHPLQTESVTYIIQRAESLVSLCYLLTLYCFIRSIGPETSRAWRFGAFGCCLLGMMAKEVMVSAPLIVALYDRIFVAGSWREVWARRRGFHVALAATWLVLFGLLLMNFDRGGSVGFGMKTTAVDYALTQAYAISHYLWLTVWPSPLILDYGPALVRGWSHIFWPALLIVSLAVASLWTAWRGRPIGFCGVFFFAVLAPSSSVVPVIQKMAEHRMYLPLAAILSVATTLIYSFLGRKGLAILTAVAVALGVVTMRRNEDYATAIRIYEDTVTKRPDNYRAMALLADYYQRAGRLEDARQWLENALKVEPAIPEVLGNLGIVWERLGEPGRAVPYVEAALALRPHDAKLMNNLGNALILSGHVPEGIAQLEAALQLAPSFRQTRLDLAGVLAQTGHRSEAAVQYEILLKGNPDDAEARSNYSDVLVALGRNSDALGQLEEAVRLRPNDAELHGLLGAALSRAGRQREALEQFLDALRLNPADQSARQNAERIRRMLVTGQ